MPPFMSSAETSNYTATYTLLKNSVQALGCKDVTKEESWPAEPLLLAISQFTLDLSLSW